MRVSHQERPEFTSQEIFMNQWGKLLSSGIDVFDAAASKHWLEKVCRSSWAEMGILFTFKMKN